MKQVSGHFGLYKDDVTNVIVNRASTDRDRYRIARENSKKQLSQETEIKRLSDEIAEIKSLLHQLVKTVT